MCLKELNIDIDEILTASSLANKYFEVNLYNKIDNFYKLSGIPRAFIQKAIYGGRCMTRDNLKWYVKKSLCDFDARSLYPSAMNRLYCQTGKLELLQPHELNLKYLLEHTASENNQPLEESPEKYISSYVVEIKILKVNKHRHFPLIVVKDPITKTNKNINDAEGHIMIVDNITLEDFVKYQNIECEIIRGYKWTDKKDFQIREVIKHIYDLRCEYKKVNNPNEQVLKLIMNSTYGKTIQKPIETTMKYLKYKSQKKNKDGELIEISPLNNYLIKNSAKVKEINDITKNLCQVKESKQINDYATNVLLGVQILSMSKRIMNEVMTLSEDLDIKIFYQDTDSMHIEKDTLKLLENEYLKVYNRELIGDKMGQFHNDFDEVKDGYTTESIFLGKKAYIDILTNDNADYGIHYRMKGIILECIKDYADSNNIEILDVYKKLLNNESITFDLLKVKCAFKTDKNRQIRSLKDFKRCVSFKGEINEY